MIYLIVEYGLVLGLDLCRDAKDRAKTISAEDNTSLAEELFRDVRVGSPVETLFGVPVVELATLSV